MINCFTFTYKTLAKQGYEFPKEMNGYSLNNLKQIAIGYEDILTSKLHYDYFKSFCTVVDKAQADDIVVTDRGVGIAINNIKYITIKENNKNKVLENITQDCTIFRIGIEEPIIEPLKEIED